MGYDRKKALNEFWRRFVDEGSKQGLQFQVDVGDTEEGCIDSVENGKRAPKTGDEKWHAVKGHVRAIAPEPNIPLPGFEVRTVRTKNVILCKGADGTYYCRTIQATVRSLRPEFI